MQKEIWLSFDLGITGDYQNFYAWLDDKGAKETGQHIAFLKYSFDPAENIFDALKKDLSSKVKFDTNDRVYAIVFGRQKDDQNSGGRFIIGKRKSSPWKGFGELRKEIIDV